MMYAMGALERGVELDGGVGGGFWEAAFKQRAEMGNWK